MQKTKNILSSLKRPTSLQPFLIKRFCGFLHFVAQNHTWDILLSPVATQVAGAQFFHN